jgi:Cys-tRNA(Pro)/Cys-tRNA(Cys) deacylase
LSVIPSVARDLLLTDPLKKKADSPFASKSAQARKDTRHRMIDYVKTNAARILDGLAIAYDLREYQVDPDDLAAETVAAKIGLPPEQVFKTLLARGDRNGPCFAVIPGNYEVDLKALAAATGDRRIALVPLKEVQPLTGYIRGGVTALGAKKDFPVFLDEVAELFDVISVSAGMRGTQILISPADYIRATEAVVAEISKEKR